jgi:hypothetical protein
VLQAVALSALTFSSAASADVLVNLPDKTIHCLSPIKTGVWYQTYSGGPRWYSISIYRPNGTRAFYRSGSAPSSGWRYFYWKPVADRFPPPGLSAVYRVVYHTAAGSYAVRVRVFCGE